MVSSLGEKLKYLREKNCLKQEDVARFLKVSRASISKYESGDREPDIDTLKALAKYYTVPVDFLFGLTDFPYSSAEYHSLKNESIVSDVSKEVYLERSDLEEFMKNEDFIRIAKKIKEYNLDLKTVESILDNIILLNKNNLKT